MYLRGVFVLFSTTYAWTSTWIIVQCNCTPEWPHALFPYTNHPCTWWKYDQIRPIQLPACLLTSVSCPLKRRRPRLRKTAARVARLRIMKPCMYYYDGIITIRGYIFRRRITMKFTTCRSKFSPAGCLSRLARLSSSNLSPEPAIYQNLPWFESGTRNSRLYTKFSR